MSNDQSTSEKVARPVTSEGRAQRNFASLQASRGFVELEHDRDGPTLIRIGGMAITQWRRVSGRRGGAMYEQEGPNAAPTREQ